MGNKSRAVQGMNTRSNNLMRMSSSKIKTRMRKMRVWKTILTTWAITDVFDIWNINIFIIIKLYQYPIALFQPSLLCFCPGKFKPNRTPTLRLVLNQTLSTGR